MKRISLANALVIGVHLLIAGWALRKVLAPDSTLELLRLFSFC